ncbi:MAG: LLM class flavin-dependent oxidoreductase [bacterium]|nr:LLM class flavin-dependent oxidoreductase [bacterium]
MTTRSIGIQLGATTAPADIPEVAGEAEQLGYAEMWMAEDYFQLGGISSVATALAATERIPVGLGVVAAAARHPAVTAMEFATLGGLYPARFMAGLGHGAPGWVHQMGLQPASPLGLLREATDAVGRLLDGQVVTEPGDYFSFDQVQLHHPPEPPPPIYFGVQGPASLRLSGEVADGTLLGWFSSPGYVAWARQRIEEGRKRANRTNHHELAVLCVLSISEHGPAAAKADLIRWATPMLNAMAESPQVKLSDGGRQLLTHLERGDQIAAASLLGEFAAAGDHTDCATTIGRLLDAGADRIVLVPNPAGFRSTPQMLEQIQAGASLIDM